MERLLPEGIRSRVLKWSAHGVWCCTCLEHGKGVGGSGKNARVQTDPHACPCVSRAPKWSDSGCRGMVRLCMVSNDTSQLCSAPSAVTSHNGCARAHRHCQVHHLLQLPRPSQTYPCPVSTPQNPLLGVGCHLPNLPAFLTITKWVAENPLEHAVRL